MNFYVDIRLLPDPEFKPTVLMNALFNKLHLALVKNKETGIGISFPLYDIECPTLGACLRLHGNEASLRHFIDSGWATGMSGYLNIREVTPVPATKIWVFVRRVQIKSNVDRIRRRYAIRHNISEKEASNIIPENIEKRLTLPFVTIKSQSTGQNFRLFIKQDKINEENSPLQCNSYGLSTDGALPYF